MIADPPLLVTIIDVAYWAWLTYVIVCWHLVAYVPAYAPAVHEVWCGMSVRERFTSLIGSTMVCIVPADIMREVLTLAVT